MKKLILLILLVLSFSANSTCIIFYVTSEGVIIVSDTKLTHIVNGDTSYTETCKIRMERNYCYAVSGLYYNSDTTRYNFNIQKLLSEHLSYGIEFTVSMDSLERKILQTLNDLSSIYKLPVGSLNLQVGLVHPERGKLNFCLLDFSYDAEEKKVICKKHLGIAPDNADVAYTFGLGDYEIAKKYVKTHESEVRTPDDLLLLFENAIKEQAKIHPIVGSDVQIVYVYNNGTYKWLKRSQPCQ